MTVSTPAYLLFAQHGWADTGSAIADLARQVTSDAAPCHVEAPSLGYLQTWLQMAPLVQAVDELATATMAHFPDAPLRIIGHSMGGLIWLEVLHRHPEWWPRLECLVLLASPVGGADLGRIVDPFGIGIGVAADLGMSRRHLAEPIAARRPVLVIAGDVDGGSDGTVPVEATKVSGAQFVCLEGLSHPVLRNHPTVAEAIRRFWAGEVIGELWQEIQVIQQLRQIPGMTDAHPRGFHQARVFMSLPDGAALRTWQSPLGTLHVYVVSRQGDCLYAGFVGWLHQAELWRRLQAIKENTRWYSA